MGIEDDQSGYCYKDSDGTGNFLLLGDESSPHAKASMRVASRKGFHFCRRGSRPADIGRTNGYRKDKTKLFLWKSDKTI
jgi:hypothetical protein